MTLTRPTDLCQRRVRLSREPASVREARSQVREVIRAWTVPVDPDIAILLTSDLVTNAIMHGRGATITLSVRCSRSQLRVDVYDTSRALPITVAEPAGKQTGCWLALVAALSAESGSFHTPAGHAAYFTLPFQSDLSRGADPTAPGGPAEAANSKSHPPRRPH
jgi:hypothetical protein